MGEIKLTNKLGDAQSPEEIAAENAISKVASWHGKSVHYQRILGGLTNINWKVHVAEDGRNYFLKVPGENTEIFIDRRAAYDASRKASASGRAAELVHYIEDDEIEIFEFLDDFRSCTVADMLDQHVRLNVIDAYRTIHRGELFELTKTGFQQIEEHTRQVAEFGGRTPPDATYFQWQVKRAEDAIMASGMDLAPCYNDGYVTNYMVDENRNIRIIDWEYAANNDPMWDLAVFSLECFFDVAARQEMIERYFGQFRQDVSARLEIYYGLACVKWGYWAALQGSISAIPFDFYKYSDLLFLRARKAMREWRWEEALLEV